MEHTHNEQVVTDQTQKKQGSDDAEWPVIKDSLISRWSHPIMQRLPAGRRAAALLSIITFLKWWWKIFWFFVLFAVYSFRGEAPPQKFFFDFIYRNPQTSGYFEHRKNFWGPEQGIKDLYVLLVQLSRRGRAKYWGGHGPPGPPLTTSLAFRKSNNFVRENLDLLSK